MLPYTDISRIATLKAISMGLLPQDTYGGYLGGVGTLQNYRGGHISAIFGHTDSIFVPLVGLW